MEPDTDIIKALEALGFEPTETNIGQFRIFANAMNLYVERNERYRDLWRKYGIKDSLAHMRSKLARTEFAYELNGKLHTTDLDDPHDLINYSAFCIRNAQEGT